MDLAKHYPAIERWLVTYLARRLGKDAPEIDIRRPFVEYSLPSLEALLLVNQLSEWLQIPISPTAVWDHPCVEQLAQYLANEVAGMTNSRRPRHATQAVQEPIAIIGMGCRFPGANGLLAFWRLLCEGRDAVTPVPPNRWDAQAFFDLDPNAPGKMMSCWGGFIDNLDQFDAFFFGISPREAAELDPRQRLMLECAWEALEDAGIPPDSLAGSQTGVFVSSLAANYGGLIADHYQIVDAYFGTGNGNSVLSNRISYTLDLRGPSLTVDTACSGSLVALHLACQSLQSGESHLALAGGVNVILRPEDSIFFSKTGALSVDGRCKTFDRRANGIVRSDGAGVVVLKPLARAVADGDRIYAVIRGSAVNQDGSSNGILAPNEQAQEALLRTAYQRAGVAPQDVQLVEAHGTGTPLGDPIEVNALARVLTPGRPALQRCALGSVKTNIGHTEAAAGVAGVIKVALAITHRVIPPNLHFQEPNPLIPFHELPMYVPLALEPWPSENAPLVAGVSGFGFSGTNAHLVITEPPAPTAPAPGALEPPYLLPISSRGAGALRDLARAYQNLAQQPETEQTLADLVYTASVRRSHLDHRLALLVSSREELAGALEAFLDGAAHPAVLQGHRRRDRTFRVVFVFSGQGSHWLGMGRSLFAREPAFRAQMECCDQLFERYAGWSLLSELVADPDTSRLNDTDVAQPMIFAIQVALAALWQSWGITPACVVGQSLGEVAAAHVAGALTLEDAVRIIVHRSRLMKLVAGRGKTAVVGLPWEQAQLVLTGFEDALGVAGTNSPNTSVLSGDPEMLARVLRSLERQGIFCRMIPGVDVAFHSPQMDQLQPELVAALGEIRPQATRIPLISTVTGTAIEGTCLDAEYWGRNLREPFRMAPVIQQLARDGYEIYLEISPHPVLSPAISEGIRPFGNHLRVLPSLRRNEPEPEALLVTLGALYTAGQQVNWSGLYPDPQAHNPAPHYPWQRERYWYDQLLAANGAGHSIAGTSRARLNGATIHPLLGEHILVVASTGQHLWNGDLNAHTPHYLDHHRVHGAVVMPGAAYLEMALSALQQIDGAPVRTIEELTFVQPLVLSPETVRRTQVVLAPTRADQFTFEVFSQPAQAGAAWVPHARARIGLATGAQLDEHAAETITEIQARCSEYLAGATHYQAMAERGFQYGPSFQAVTAIWRRDGEALGHLQLPAPLEVEAARYHAHPALLDACFQVVAQVGAADTADEQGGAPVTRLPAGVRRATVYRRPERRVWCHARLCPGSSLGDDSIETDIRLFDEAGQLVAEIEGFRVQVVGALSSDDRGNIDDWFYEVQWQRAEHPQPGIRAATVDYMPPLADIVVHAQRLAPELGVRHQLDHYEGSLAELDVLSIAYVLKALRELGWSCTAGQQFSIPELADRLGVIAQHRRLFGRMVEMLAEETIVEPDGDAWRVCRTPADHDPQPLFEAMIAKYPLSGALLTLAQQCGQRLAQVLRGAIDPLQLLFGASSTTVETFYIQSPYFPVYNTMTAEAIKHALEQMPAGRVAQILEIGGGTGGTTASVLPLLPAERVQYVFTDISPLFTAKAADKFRAYPFITYKLLDIERDPIGQGFAPQQFDIILASNVLHATVQLRETLAAVQQLLAPGGLLILQETPGPQRWLDITFGLTEGWWKFTDADLRPSYPLLTQQGWMDLLKEIGFAAVGGLTDGRAISPQYAVMARADQAVATTGQAPQTPPGYWIVLRGGDLIEERLAEQIEGAGDVCIQVALGLGYRRIDTTSYEVAPGSPEDFESLLRDLTAAYPLPCHGIVYCGSMAAAPSDQTTLATIDHAQQVSYFGLIYLVQALVRAGLNPPPRLWLVSRGTQPIGPDPVAINQALIWGVGRTLLMEHPELYPTLIDLDRSASAYEAEPLFNEFRHPTDETQVAFRAGQRYVARVVRSELFGGPVRPVTFRPDGSYLITGGLSGIGLEVARWMAASGARRLILIARTPLPPRTTWNQLADDSALADRVAAVRELETLGASVHVAALDVGDADQLATFLATYRAEGWPAIRGVVHSAGLIQDQLVLRMDPATFHTVVRPKIQGTWLLHTLLSDAELDFFVLFSSATSVMGMYGQSNYAAGNAFVDAVAHYRRSLGLPGMSINWGVWADVGIIARSGLKDRLIQDGMIPISSAQGIAVLERLWQHTPAQTAPMPANWTRWRQVYARGENIPFFSQLVNTVASEPGLYAPADRGHQFIDTYLLTAPEQRGALLEEHLHELVAAVLRFERSRLELDQPLNMVGLDSIMAVELKHQIELHLGVSLAIVELLQGASVAQLAERITAVLEAHDQEMAALLSEVEQLSTEEVHARLAEG